jgi:hypothetical protein
MIYIAKKNGHTRVFSDADGKKKLLHYRRKHWKITAKLGKPAEAHPAPHRDVSSEDKPNERREKHLHKVRILGRWVVVD